MQQQWSAVDNYLIKALIPSDPVLDRVLENNHRAGLPAHDVAANQGQFLALLVRLTGLSGYWRSAPSAAIAPSGWRASFLQTANSSPRRPTRIMPVARENLQLAGVDQQVTLREDPRYSPRRRLAHVPLST